MTAQNGALGAARGQNSAEWPWWLDTGMASDVDTLLHNASDILWVLGVGDGDLEDYIRGRKHRGTMCMWWR